MMTGESIPADKTIGDEVLSGTVNQFGVFEMRATKVGEDRSLERMIRLIEETDADKTPIVRLADSWATWIVLLALGAAIGTFLVTQEWVRAVTVLVVFCPCAFILATPTAVVAAIGNATKHGFLVRSGASMEVMAEIDTITFDKTGTLTCGIPTVSGVKGLSGYSDDDIYRLFAVAEKQSEHPLGRAIVRSYGENTDDPEDFKVIPGRGVSCRAEGHDILAGNLALMEENGVAADKNVISECCREGEIAVFMSVDGTLSGIIMLEDVIRDDSAETVEWIKSLGVRPVLMTGDNEHVAERIAAAAGIADVVPNCLPEDKLNGISELQSDDCKVCMVGDGINDAPALRKADIGIAMGGIGSDIAIEASDITLVSDDISQIPHMLALSKKMMGKIKVNILLSMILNISGVVLAMFTVLNPVSAALFHNIGSVFVVVNSALLLGWRSSFDRSAEEKASRPSEEASIS
jgi:heavy metal translocating P-type ATPase